MANTSKEDLAFVKYFDPEMASDADQRRCFEIRAQMSREEVYDLLDGSMKYGFRVGGIAYDRETEQGTRPLSLEDAAKLTTEELCGVFVFIMEMNMGAPKDAVAQETLCSVSEILDHRDGWKKE